MSIATTINHTIKRNNHKFVWVVNMISAKVDDGEDEVRVKYSNNKNSRESQNLSGLKFSSYNIRVTSTHLHSNIKNHLPPSLCAANRFLFIDNK